jgi:hypothetical protein
MKYANGIFAAIFRLWTRLFGRHLKAATAKPKTTKPREPIGSVGGKGHYFESIGQINRKFHSRRSQSQRRKHERKTGRRAA